MRLMAMAACSVNDGVSDIFDFVTDVTNYIDFLFIA
jgi:hypothetical protein